MQEEYRCRRKQATDLDLPTLHFTTLVYMMSFELTMYNAIMPDWLAKRGLLSERLCVRVGPSLHQQIQRAATRRGQGVSKLARWLIDQLLATPTPKASLLRMEMAMSRYAGARRVLAKLRRLAREDREESSALREDTGNVRLARQPLLLLSSLSVEFDLPGEIILADALSQFVVGEGPAGEEGNDRFLWCGLCEHAYARTEVLTDEEADVDEYGQMSRCPTPDCYGDPSRDGLDWSQVRAAHPTYPEAPEPGARYAHNPLPL